MESRLPVIDGQGSSGASFPIHEFPSGSEFFCGREEVLRDVEESIVDCEKETASHRRIVAIVGLGGMGKSEIAKQMGQRLQEKYDFIFWFNAQTRRPLESGFKQVAAILNISLPSEDSLMSILRDMYRHLAKNYKKTIFIFDNAEELKARPGIYGLEEYLVPNLQCKKPVFLITSRYPWGSVRQEIRCIQLDRLSNDESYKCLLKYLHVEDSLLPTSLKETTKSLAQRLEGYPLLLSLFGWTVADKADMISLDTIESRVQSYTKLLEGPQLDAVTEESKYEERLEIILRSTVLNMATTPEGKIAVELLNIIALLSPDSIHAGLVKGIYCGKHFEPESDLCPGFVWEDLDTSVSMGLKILVKVSLIKIERKTYKNWRGNLHEYDMIKVHRLIQKSTQNWLTSGEDFIAPLEKILRFREHSVLERVHIHFLLNFCMRNDFPYWESCWLLILSACLSKDSIDDRELFWKVKSFLRAKELDPDSDNILCVLETMQEDRSENVEAWTKVKSLLLELSPEFAKRSWVIQLSCDATDYFDEILREANNADFCDWLLQNYKDCNEDTRMSFRILLCLDCCDSSGDLSNDQELISKVLSSYDFANQSERHSFWKVIWYFITDCTTEQRIKQLEWLVNGPEGNVFASSLQFSQDSSKVDFLKYWAINFCDRINDVAKIPELRKSLLANKRFLDSFWDITSFNLTWSSVLVIRVYLTESITLIRTWCFLFQHDVAVYECFGRKMDSGIQDWLRQHRQSLRDHKSILCYLHGDYIRYILEFADAKHCSSATRNWIRELLKLADSISSDSSSSDSSSSDSSSSD